MCRTDGYISGHSWNNISPTNVPIFLQKNAGDFPFPLLNKPPPFWGGPKKLGVRWRAKGAKVSNPSQNVQIPRFPKNYSISEMVSIFFKGKYSRISNHLPSIMFRGYVKTLGGYFNMKMTITVAQRFEIIDFIFSDPSGVPKATSLAVVSKIQQKKLYAMCWI